MAGLFAVVQSKIRFDKNINGDTKLMLCEIEQWNEERDGELSAHTLAELYGFNTIQVRKMVEKLITSGYLTNAYDFIAHKQEV